MEKQKQKTKNKDQKNILLPLILLLIFLSLFILTFQIIFLDKFLPRVFVGDTHLMLLTKSKAIQVLQNKFDTRASSKLELNYKEQKFIIDLATSSAKLNIQPAIEEAFSKDHQFQTLIFGKIITPKIELPPNPQINKIAKTIYKEPKNASLSILEKEATPSFKIEQGESGLILDEEKLKQDITDFLIFGKYPSNLPLKIVEPKFTTQKAVKAKTYLEDLLQNPIKLTFKNSSWTIDSKTLLPLLDFEQKDSIISQEKLLEYIKKNIAKDIDQPVVEALFQFNEANQRVTTFKPAQEGQKLDIPKTSSLVTAALDNLKSKNISLPVDVVYPKIQTEQVNNLGIKELLGQGISHFSGSITNRIYNLSLAASRINGVLIPPNEDFSFNEKVGDISAETGYKQAYVIKEGRTVLDDGGGVCQDSTTLFRAVLNAGLPVLARTAHAYRVGYYEQGFPPGLDATVWSPSVDFKFKNDTQHHILIQAYTSGNTLYVDLYGTSDGRISRLTTPVVANKTPPPPEIRQDDPTLPKGEVKQVDWAAWGADVSFKRTVTRNGENIISETWRSRYKPWQAIYLIGTKE